MAKSSKENGLPETILGELRGHLQEQTPITLYNTYLGVPITYEAEIAMVHTNFVGVIAHPYQTVCIARERRTYLQCRGFQELVRAHPVSIDFTNHVVMLERLKIPHSVTVDLYNSWIRPEKNVKVEMDSDQGVRLEGELLTVAVLPMNVIRIAVAVPEDVPYERQDVVELAFKLPAGGELIQVGGVVHSLSGLRHQTRKRLEVEGHAVMRDEISLLAYIARREDEIMKTLDEEYWDLRHKKKGY